MGTSTLTANLTIPKVEESARKGLRAAGRFSLRIERVLRERRLLIASLIGVMLVAQLFLYRPALTGNWYAGGRDMANILPELRSARSPAAWLDGPWVGRRIFNYYRPITSLAMFTEYRLFGEHVASWQVVSMCLHMASSVLFILLMLQLFRSPMVALIGGMVWALRERMDLAIAWTPAQTDMIAVFFSLLCLFGTVRVLTGGRWGWAVLAAAAGLLALGSKEVALILPVLITLLAWFFHGAPKRRRLAVAGASWAVLIIFLVWRFHCLSGLGFLPALASHNENPNHSPWPTYFNMWLRFLLPYQLGPGSSVNGLAVWVFCFCVILVFQWRHERPRAAGAIAVAGFIAVTFMLESWAQWLDLDAFKVLSIGLLWMCAFLVAVRWRRREFILAAAWGALAWLPVSHTVYNYCGNVTYLPDTYWGLLWGCIVAALLAAAAADAPAATEPLPLPAERVER